MALYLNDANTDYLARTVSNLTGETITQAINTSLKNRLEILTHNMDTERYAKVSHILLALRKNLNSKMKSTDVENLYNENGMPF